MDLNNNERLYYGFPITITEYCNSMKKIIQYSLRLNKVNRKGDINE